jgi:hypothetical protein
MDIEEIIYLFKVSSLIQFSQDSPWCPSLVVSSAVGPMRERVIWKEVRQVEASWADGQPEQGGIEKPERRERNLDFHSRSRKPLSKTTTALSRPGRPGMLSWMTPSARK